eukprot:TRINITY_DN4456_c0_g1_i1.p1 TRINITY_DN4456_c0_g1~~TRINITY_DN4456_c0_g1_i1.p1  ORF type:complete len:251 (-),score=19.84 TRINITY_DN4456_c0_g1_i1:147-899(-)
MATIVQHAMKDVEEQKTRCHQELQQMLNSTMRVPRNSPINKHRHKSHDEALERAYQKARFGIEITPSTKLTPPSIVQLIQMRKKMQSQQRHTTAHPYNYHAARAAYPDAPRQILAMQQAYTGYHGVRATHTSQLGLSHGQAQSVPRGYTAHHHAAMAAAQQASVHPATQLSAEGIRQNMLPQHRQTTRGHSITLRDNMTTILQTIMQSLSNADRQQLQAFLSKPAVSDETKSNYLKELYQHVLKMSSRKK